MVCPCRPYHFKFLKGCLLQIYLVHSWILWSTYKVFWGIFSLVAIVPILYPWKNQKIKGFLVFSEGIKWSIDHKMVKKLRDQCSHFIILENTRKLKVSSCILGLVVFWGVWNGVLATKWLKSYLINVPILYSLKTPENQRFPDVFWGWCFSGGREGGYKMGY